MSDDMMPVAAPKKSFFARISPDAWLIATSIVVAAIFIVSVSQVGRTLKTVDTTGETPDTLAPDSGGTEKGVVSIDDDPILGKPDAPVTIVEFSDYECPFCKRHFTETYPELKKQYIDTGKAKLVFRDFPLSFHDPMATKEAVAATCVREQGGDSAYFKMHELMFTKTTSNGTGLTEDQVNAFAKSLGVDMTKFAACTQDQDKKDEVAKDIADGTAAGVSGTPSFIVGPSQDDGTIKGELVVGAQPLAAFQAVIDPLLK